MRMLIQLVLLNLSFDYLRGCSDISKYYSDFYGTFGLVKIPHVQLQQNIFVEIHLSVAARLPNGNEWKIMLVNTNVYDDLLHDRDLHFKFFPIITNPFPIVTGVFVNKNQICSSAPARGNFITTIKLQYTYTLNNIPQNYQNSLPVQTTINPQVFYQKYETTTRPSPTLKPRPKPTQQMRTTQLNIIDKIQDTENTEEFNVCGIKRSKQSFTSFVIGGQKAMRNEFPWLAAFYYRENGFICGGTILSKRIVVTAAHCVQDKLSIEKKRPYDSTFYLGKYNLKDLDEKNYMNSGVDTFHIHPDWSPFEESYKGDLCVAVLSKTVIFNDFIIPLCIWTQTYNHDDLINKQGIVAGWGITQNGKTSEVPMYLSLPVVDDLKCLRSNEVYSKITSDSNFCAGDGSGRSPCNGDSGGAFAVQNPNDHKYYFRGIVSSGLKRKENGSCDNFNYAIFTDAAYYTQWISGYIYTYG